jgi:phosphatidylserine/phosphatidylglycerophosphate/cardiolipin synthase-like enzyme
MAGLGIVALAAVACGIVEPEVDRGARGKADSDNGFDPRSGAEALCRVEDPDALREAIAAHVEDGGAWFSTPALQRMLDEQTNSTSSSGTGETFNEVTTGNQVTLLVNGVESYQRRYDNIAEADVVLLKTYNYRENEAGREIVRKLIDLAGRAERDPFVFLQFDRKGYGAGFMNTLRMWIGQRLGLKSPLPELKGKLEGRTVDLFERLQEQRNAFVMPVNAPSGKLKITDREVLRRFNPAYGKDHEKYLITWKRGEPVRVIMGGLNVGDEWAVAGSSKTWTNKDGHEEHGYRDTDLEIVGPAARLIVQEFIHDASTKNWEHLQDLADGFGEGPKLVHKLKQALEPEYGKEASRLEQLLAEMDQADAFAAPLDEETGARIRFVANRPAVHDADGQYIEKALCLMMQAAPKDTQVRLSNALVYPPASFEVALRKAVENGVRFDLLLNNEKAPKPFGTLSEGARCMMGALYSAMGEEAEEQVVLYRWPGGDEEVSGAERQALEERGLSTIHQKVWSFGTAETDPLIIGSSNLDYHSLRHNTEGAVVIEHPATKRAFDRMLNNDFDLLDEKPDDEFHVSGVTRVSPAEVQSTKCSFKEMIQVHL